MVAAAAEAFDKMAYSEQQEPITDEDRVNAAQAYAALDTAVQLRHKKFWFKINRYLLHRI